MILYERTLYAGREKLRETRILLSSPSYIKVGDYLTRNGEPVVSVVMRGEEVELKTHFASTVVLSDEPIHVWRYERA